MASFLYRATRRRFLSLLLGGLAFLYAFSLLIYVQFIPDLGLRSAFSTALKAPPKLVEGDAPPIGSIIRKVGAHEIRSWSNLVKSPFWVQRDLAYIREAGTLLPSWARIEETESEEPKAWIRVEYDPPGNGAETHVAWCQLAQLPTDERLPTLLWFLLKVFLFLIGLLAYWKRPNERATALFYFMAITNLVAFTGGYHWSQIVNHPVYILGFMLAGVMLPAITLHFYHVFPRPKPWLIRYPRLRWALYAPPVAFLTVMLACYVRIRIDVRNNGDAASALEFLAGVVLVYLGVSGLYFLAAIGCLFHSWSRAQDSLERNQVKWILFGSIAAVIPVGYAGYLAIWQPHRFALGAGTWPIFAASALLTLAYAISITRYRLLEVDKLLTTSVGYFLSSFLAAILYYAVVFLGTLIFNQALSGPRLNETLAVSASALLLLVVLDQARWRIRKALDRRYSHDQSQLDRTFERMGKAIEQLIDSQALVQKLLQSTTDLLAVQQASAFVRDGERLKLAGSVGAAPPMAELELSFPLCESLVQGRVMLGKVRTPHLLTPAQKQLLFLGGEVGQPILDEGRLLGFLVLGPKETGWKQQDFDLLSAFAQIGALALENAEGHRTIEVLNQDLQGKIKKISEQQRRIFALQTQLHRQTLASDQPVATGPVQPEVPEAANELAPAIATVGPGGVVGSGEEVGKLNVLVRKVAATDAVVLIRGESGTGKELVAKAVHETSARAEKPFVKVHCAALSSSLLESELFGHVKGAFTGAHRDKVGRFEMADGGTLFLDEIGDVSLEVQTKLLRVLQERTFERVGSSDSIKVDVRILAATHQSLETLIRQGKFREDLFYRLNVFPVVVPPLRQRIEDIPELAIHFVRLSAHRCKKPVKGIDDEALLALKNYAWPGNIRQLENTIERAVVIAEGEIITSDELPSEVFAAPAPSGVSRPLVAMTGSAASLPSSPRVSVLRSERERLERERMLQALADAGGNKAEAARALGVARSTLLSRMKKLGIDG
jgi:transcriptional regulator with GAF, ATPase, and Fis domain